MNWYQIMLIPVTIFVYMMYFPIYNDFVGDLFPIVDAANYVLYPAFIKVMFGLVPIVLVFAFLWQVIGSVTEPSMPKQVSYS